MSHSVCKRNLRKQKNEYDYDAKHIETLVIIKPKHFMELEIFINMRMFYVDIVVPSSIPKQLLNLVLSVFSINYGPLRSHLSDMLFIL